MTPPRRLSDIRFHGGSALFWAFLDFERPADEQIELLDRHLAEVFYDSGFMLSIGYTDASGLADGTYPDGEFRVTITSLSGPPFTIREWRTRDLPALRRLVLKARDEAQRLRVWRDVPTPLLRLRADDARLSAAREWLRSALPGRGVQAREEWDGACLLFTVPPLTLEEMTALEPGLAAYGWAEADAFAGRLAWVRERGPDGAGRTR